MKGPQVDEVTGMDAINSISANSPNDSVRCQTADKSTTRFTSKAPHVANPDNMGSSGSVSQDMSPRGNQP